LGRWMEFPDSSRISHIWKQNIFCTRYRISSRQSRIQFRKYSAAILDYWSHGRRNCRN